MVVYKNNIKRLFTNKARLFIIFVLPLLFCVLFLSDSNEITVKMAVTDDDQTKVTRDLIKALSKHNSIVEQKEDTINDLLIIGALDYAITIEEGFTERLLQGEEVHINEHYFIDSGKIQPVRIYINNYMDNIQQTIAKASNKDDVYHRLDTQKAYFRVHQETQYKKSPEEAVAAIGMMLQFILFMSVVTTALLLIDKEKKTILRIMTSNMSKMRYMAENLLSFITIAMIQILFIFGVYIGIMGFHFDELSYTLILVSLFAVVAMTFSMLIVSMVKREIIAYGIILFSATPLVMLGGGYFDPAMMSNGLQKVAKFVPTTWVMDGVRDLLIHDDTSKIFNNYAVLLTFAITFFMMSIIAYRKNTIN